MRPIEMMVGRQVGATRVIFNASPSDVAMVECYNGMTKEANYFYTTEEKGKAILNWLEAGRPGMIKDALPQLTTDEREQCLSGITPTEWEEMFSDGE